MNLPTTKRALLFAALAGWGALAVIQACAAPPVCPPPPPPAPCDRDLAPLPHASAAPSIDDPVHPKDAEAPPTVAASDAGSIDAAPNVAASSTPSKDGGPPAVAKTGPKPAASPDPSSCGTKDNLCPLQKMMRGEMTGASSGPAMAAAFAHAANLSPNGGWQWRAISQKGAELAKAGDTAAAKAQCKACHDAYKEPYKASFRARPIH